MSQVPQAERFQELLKNKFISLGLSPEVAASVSQKITPVRRTDSLVFAECNDDFYSKNIVSKMLAEIDNVAKECWGKGVQFVIQQATPLKSGHATGQSTETRARRKRTTARPAMRDSLFMWEPELARAEESQKVDQNGNSLAEQTGHEKALSTPTGRMEAKVGLKSHKEGPTKSLKRTNRQNGQISGDRNDPPTVAVQTPPKGDIFNMARVDSKETSSHSPGKNTDQRRLENPPEEHRRSGAAAASSQLPLTNLQRDFLFDTYVRGQSNMVAYSACEAVARSPGKLSNPVFIYGATGLGKTHLLHAVGNEILMTWPAWNIVYVSSQDFMNELITSIRFNKTGEFRTKYHAADVLLVDDIQFLESKESTQMEFFHIFNVLCEKNRQIVITSDKYPKDIPNIEERLKSRFLQGLIADIEPPSYEDRLAIIEAKAKMMNLDLTAEIIAQIASHVRSNVREIQGVLTNLLMGQSMTGKSPTPESTNEVLRRIVNMKGPSIDVATIQKIVAQHFALKVSDLTSPKREKRLVLPRHIAMYLAKDLMNIALKEIAESFHRGDHTTVQHAIRKVEQLISSDESTRASVKELKRKLEQCL